MTAREVGDRFLRGLVAGLLGWATVIALSYFVRSGGWGNLLGTRPGAVEAIGVPWVIWVAGQPYGRVGTLLADAGIGLLVGVVAGVAWMRFGSRYARASTGGELLSEGTSPFLPRQFQFRLRTLFGVTAMLAVLLAVGRTAVTARPVLLAIVYFLGPSLILAVWYRLRRVRSAYRNGVVIAATLLLVLAAAVLGQSIHSINDFTKGIFGTFVFWTPQWALLVCGLAVWRSLPGRRREQRGVLDPSDGASDAS